MKFTTQIMLCLILIFSMVLFSTSRKGRKAHRRFHRSKQQCFSIQKGQDSNYFADASIDQNKRGSFLVFQLKGASFFVTLCLVQLQVTLPSIGLTLERHKKISLQFPDTTDQLSKQFAPSPEWQIQMQIK